MVSENLPVPVRGSGFAGRLAAFAVVIDRVFEPFCLLVMCFMLCLGSLVSALVYVRKADGVLKQMSEISRALDEKMEVNRELCRQTRAYVDAEMPKYDVSARLDVMDREIEEIIVYTRETRKYVEWER